MQVVMEFQAEQVICLKSISDSFDWLVISLDILDQVVTLARDSSDCSE
jgi:hypothetical protein